jgi:hypothetical protein
MYRILKEFINFAYHPRQVQGVPLAGRTSQ